MQKIRKIVIPVAGYGTRFLPFTKSIPKEMLPLVDRPVIQYIVEEAVEAGIEEVILITGYSKRAIEDYFDYNLELEYLLEKSGKLEQKKLIRDVSDVAQFVYIRQKEMRGHGHALLQAKSVVGDEPFVVMWGDDIYQGKPSKLQQLIAAYEKLEAPVLFTTQKTEKGDGDRYGYLEVGDRVDDRTFTVKDMVEKPGDEGRPSPYACLGCFILTPDIFPFLEKQEPGKGGEIVTLDAVNALAKERPVYAHECTGLKYFDCGNKLEYMKANVEFALQREDIGEDFRNYLKNLNP
jgi:UTP--glucose-1-phosphate uridylyltransferase